MSLKTMLCKIVGHDFSHNCESCSRCSKERENPRDYEDGHDFSKDCESCSRCFKQRKDAHKWNRCKCTSCGQIHPILSDEDVNRHQWDSALKCSICGSEKHVVMLQPSRREYFSLLFFFGQCYCRGCSTLESQSFLVANRDFLRSVIAGVADFETAVADSAVCAIQIHNLLQAAKTCYGESSKYILNYPDSVGDIFVFRGAAKLCLAMVHIPNSLRDLDAAWADYEKAVSLPFSGYFLETRRFKLHCYEAFAFIKAFRKALEIRTSGYAKEWLDAQAAIEAKADSEATKEWLISTLQN